jgi:hypothetical protein
MNMNLKQLIQLIRRLPRSIEHALKERQRQTVVNELEVERLDRIRNPSKYRGK